MGDQVDTAEPHFHGLCRIVLNNADIKPDLREASCSNRSLNTKEILDTLQGPRSYHSYCATRSYERLHIYTVTNITCQQKGHVDVYNTDQ